MPFLWKGFTCLKAAEPLGTDSWLLTTKSPGITGTYILLDIKLTSQSRKNALQPHEYYVLYNNEYIYIWVSFNFFSLPKGQLVYTNNHHKRG